MPAELRHIVFRPVEVVNAIREYRRRMRRPLPAGYLRGFRIVDRAGEGSVCAVLDVSPDGGAAAEALEVAGPELAAALILYCIDHRIPLPAQANKALKKFGEHVTLIVTLNPKGEEEALPETL